MLPFLLTLQAPILALVMVCAPMGVTAEVFHHALGKATLHTTPQRVVTLYQGATDSAVALGIEPAGMVESWDQRPVYRYLRDHLSEPTLLGLETQPDLEGIAGLRPDLILAARHRHREVYPLLSRIALTLVIDDVYDFKGTLATLARATGRVREGDRLLSCWDARVRHFRQRIAEKQGDNGPREVAILSFRGDHARIYYDGFARRVLTELGFSAPETHRKEGWGIKLTSQESIPAMDAGAIFIFMQDDPAVQRTFDEWTGHPLWERLEAVKQQKVYQVDPVAWNMGGGIMAANRMLDDLYRHYDIREAPAC